jgi:hypothetical protein
MYFTQHTYNNLHEYYDANHEKFNGFSSQIWYDEPDSDYSNYSNYSDYSVNSDDQNDIRGDGINECSRYVERNYMCEDNVIKIEGLIKKIHLSSGIIVNITNQNTVLMLKFKYGGVRTCKMIFQPNIFRMVVCHNIEWCSD